MKIKAFAGVAALALAGTIAAGSAQARDQIQIVGSSTVFPFSTAVAEQFGQKTEFKTPVVESTGSGGGIKLFCEGVGEGTPDITNASRRMKEKELVSCQGNGVTPVEVTVGFDGIVLANAITGPSMDVTREQIFLALAKQVPVDGKLVANPYTNWSEIDPSLPNEKIEVLGPPPTSGTRDAFEELVMEEGCEAVPGAAEAGLEGDVCTEIREDGGYVEAGENDNLIVQKLNANPAAFGIFGFSFLDQNADKVKGASIGGVAPTFEAISDASYPVSRSLYFYVKKEHVGVIPGIAEYVAEFTNEDTWGSEGYLADKGLIPLSDERRAEVAASAAAMTPLKF
ncbi:MULTISPECIES: substrate-binding domain-containing protein [Pseudovibrio]|uniref:substrate-binding domain-containing protein n=1 Tax=Stappiaceae TaxID=2821832 RepID=UPI0023650A15|nr:MULTISPECIES: substrate-binding domain-containing protein [Pseudovibrio]MDD7911173.1 substrate-binding domain-containing protein [Pseudovibrio exalbescens]MDX5593140.1 substrate-binding domain-containing protein [Pseudovibrio sp. SPO723]